MDRVLAKNHLADDVNRIGQERLPVELLLQQSDRALLGGLFSDDDYRRVERALEELPAGLLVPGVDSTKAAGALLED